jgi:hypothetical protein
MTIINDAATWGITLDSRVNNIAPRVDNYALRVVNYDLRVIKYALRVVINAPRVIKYALTEHLEYWLHLQSSLTMVKTFI